MTNTGRVRVMTSMQLGLINFPVQETTIPNGRQQQQNQFQCCHTNCVTIKFYT